MTEEEMRDYKVPFFSTLDEVVSFIKSLETEADDYGKAAYCASLAGQAAFNYICHKEGLTGFQASCADLHMIGKIRHMSGPFILLDGEDLLYPQYDLHGKLSEFIDSVKTWTSDEAQKKLDDPDNKNAHPNVIAHWKKLTGR